MLPITFFDFFRLPPPPLAPTASFREVAERAHYYGGSTDPDFVWCCRKIEQDERNDARRRDWETRFLILGPRPQDI